MSTAWAWWQELEQDIDGVGITPGGGQGRALAVEQAGALAGVAAADLARCPRRTGHRAGPRQALKIEHQVIVAGADVAQQAEEGSRSPAAVEQQDLVDRGAGLDQRRETVADDPGDAAVRSLVPDRLGDLQTVQDVTDRRRFDD
jgi:hypothetical protein